MIETPALAKKMSTQNLLRLLLLLVLMLRNVLVQILKFGRDFSADAWLRL